MKDINNNFKYLYRNRESYNREIPIQEALERMTLTFIPWILPRKRGRKTSK